MDRVEIGRLVSTRLGAADGVQRAPVGGVELFMVRDFLDDAQSSALISLIDANRKPSPLFVQGTDPKFRTSETCVLDPSERVVMEVDAALLRLVGLPAELGERLQGQRYETGQQYKPHYDFLGEREAYWVRQQKLGGQRTWTAMVFLGVPEAGGATRFPVVGVTIPPRRGTLVLWNNLDAAGRPNRNTLHQGMPVTAGVKHIITKWWRERRWGPPVPASA